MTHTSLDGRNIRSSKITPKLTGDAASNLRPALPPPKNPWLRPKAPVMSSVTTEDFPALPGANNVPEKGDTAPEGVKAVPEKQAAVSEQPDTVPEQADVVIEADAMIERVDAMVEQADAVLEPADVVPEAGDTATEQASTASQQENGNSASEATLVSPKYLCPPVLPRPKDLLNEDKISDSISTCSNDSRKLFEAAAHRSSETLWKYPFGADILVYAESSTFRVHRNIITQKSGWFRQHLPPPNEDGTPVEMQLPWAAGAVGPCLMFMYTNKVDICEQDDTWPLNSIHLPRCVLGYCASVALQISTMSHHILRIVEKTANDLAEYLGTYFINREMDRADSIAFSLHLANALNIIHTETAYDLMRPMRLALAAVLDASLPCLLRQAAFAEVLNMSSWKQHSAAIATDQMEYRKTLGRSYPLKSTILPSEDELEALFDGQLKGKNVEIEAINSAEEPGKAK